MPKVRLTMHLIIPRTVTRQAVQHATEAKVSLTEQRTSIRLSIDVDNDGIGVKHVDLALTEACALADMLNRIRHKVAKRPGYAP